MERSTTSEIFAPTLNQDIIDGGVMQVYLSLFDGIFILAFSESAIQYGTTSFVPRPGEFLITRITEADTALKEAEGIYPDNQQFRYVLIPGGKSLAVKNHVDVENAEEVKRFFMVRD